MYNMGEGIRHTKGSKYRTVEEEDKERRKKKGKRKKERQKKKREAGPSFTTVYCTVSPRRNTRRN